MIREFTPADADRVMDIWLSGNLQAHAFVPFAYWYAQYDAVRQGILDAEVYVYADDRTGAVMAFIGLVGNYIAGLFVDEQARNQGIGKALLNAAKAHRSTLTLDVYQKNSRAVGFYEQAQFAIQSRGLDADTNEVEYHMIWRRPEK